MAKNQCLTAAFILLVACMTLPARGQQDAPIGGQSRSAVPRGINHYLGRNVAQTMHYTGAEWLIRNTREREERCSLMLANLDVRPGMTVCDMGCGNGFYSLKLAKMVGRDGQVLGVDIQPEMLVLLRERSEQAGIENVSPILGSMHDPRLPQKTVDLVLLVDVYHEFSHPQHMLAGMRRSLKEDGMIVLLEYRAEDPDVPIKPLHKMTRAQVDLEMKANGFKLVKSFDDLPWQHMLYYGIDPEWKAPEGYPNKINDPR
jgi:SAM-dependent methyltransferase